MKNLYAFYLVSIFVMFLTLNITAQVSGGTFKLEQTVLAGGGATGSTGGNFKIEGTIGQTAAGIRSNVSPFNMQNGFWTSQPLVPTAAEVTVSGQITTAGGSGVRNVFVTLTETNGTSHTTLSTTFGYYRFTGITAGQAVVISIRAKQFVFSQPAQVVFVNDDIDGINFVANEN